MFALDTAGTIFLRLSSSRIGNEFDKSQMLWGNFISLMLLLLHARKVSFVSIATLSRGLLQYFYSRTRNFSNV